MNKDEEQTAEQIGAILRKKLRREKSHYKNQLFDRGVIDDMIEEVMPYTKLTADSSFLLNLDVQLEKFTDSGDVFIMGYDKFSEETNEHLFKIRRFRAKKIENKWMFEE